MLHIKPDTPHKRSTQPPNPAAMLRLMITTEHSTLPSAIYSPAGRRWPASSMTEASPSTTMQPNARRGGRTKERPVCRIRQGCRSRPPHAWLTCCPGTRKPDNSLPKPPDQASGRLPSAWLLERREFWSTRLATGTAWPNAGSGLASPCDPYRPPRAAVTISLNSRAPSLFNRSLRISRSVCARLGVALEQRTRIVAGVSPTARNACSIVLSM